MKSIIIDELDIMNYLDIHTVDAGDVEHYCDTHYKHYDASSIEFDGPYVHVLVLVEE